MKFIAYAIVALVALQRLVELRYANRNTAALLRKGAVEVGRGHYPFIVALHAGWLAAIVLALPSPLSVGWIWLALFVGLQLARVWVIATLGAYWTTRIVTLEGAPLVQRGPYRFVHHPNYLIVTLEIATLPLVFGEAGVAIAFTIANAGLLAFRVREEERALRSRRQVIIDGADTA